MLVLEFELSKILFSLLVDNHHMSIICATKTKTTLTPLAHSLQKVENRKTSNKMPKLKASEEKETGVKMEHIKEKKQSVTCYAINVSGGDKSDYGALSARDYGIRKAARKLLIAQAYDKKRADGESKLEDRLKQYWADEYGFDCEINEYQFSSHLDFENAVAMANEVPLDYDASKHDNVHFYKAEDIRIDTESDKFEDSSIGEDDDEVATELGKEDSEKHTQESESSVGVVESEEPVNKKQKLEADSD